MPLHLSLEQLAEYDGTDSSKPILIAVRGRIYDVTASKEMYGPGKYTHVVVSVTY